MMNDGKLCISVECREKNTNRSTGGCFWMLLLLLLLLSFREVSEETCLSELSKGENRREVLKASSETAAMVFDSE